MGAAPSSLHSELISMSALGRSKFSTQPYRPRRLLKREDINARGPEPRRPGIKNRMQPEAAPLLQGGCHRHSSRILESVTNVSLVGGRGANFLADLAHETLVEA